MGGTEKEGFWGEWNMIHAGGACDHEFGKTASTGLVGHNNEWLQEKTVAECSAACCARPWCKSFDFGHFDAEGDFGADTTRKGTCILADTDAANQYGKTAANPSYDLYERESLPAVQPALGAAGCSTELAAISDRVNSACCPAGGCMAGPPDDCSEECAEIWMPFSKRCSEFLRKNAEAGQVSPLMAVSDLCEVQEFGKYHAGSNHGRCSDGDYQQYYNEVGPACCGSDSQYCPDAPAFPNLVTPMMDGKPYCADGCRPLLEEMYAECKPRFAAQELAPGTRDAVEAFLAVCQGIIIPGRAGGGH
jgi:hypothetical protein